MPGRSQSSRYRRAPKTKRGLLMKRTLCISIGFLLLSPAALAGIWTEVGDAGQAGPAAAQAAAGFGPLTSILGSMDTVNDADVFKIYISDPDAFFADARNSPINTYDTQLFLFDKNGNGVYANDDYNTWGGEGQSWLPPGDPHGPTTAGVYYLAMSIWDNDPVDTNNALVFNDDTYFNYVQHGTAWGIGGPWVDFDSGGDNWWGGTAPFLYEITLGGASFVPVPGAALLGIIGLSLVGWVKRRLA